MTKNISFLFSLVFLFGVFAYSNSRPISNESAAETLGGLWCTHYLHGEGCPDVLFAPNCDTIPINSRYATCFYWLDERPTPDLNCDNLPDPISPSPGVRCGQKDRWLAGPACWTHVSCAPFF